MKLLLILFTCILSLVCTAQKKVPAFGEIDKSSLTLTSCDFEPDANAMVLFSVQDLEYDYSAFSGKINSRRRVRIKIFNEKGFEAAAIRVPFYSRKKNTLVKDLKGIVYTLAPDGSIQKTEVAEEDFYRNKMNEVVESINFTFPNVKAGDVIEYTYTISEKNRLAFDPWVIQGPIPCGYAETVITVPSFSFVAGFYLGADSIEQVNETLGKGGGEKHKRTYFKSNIPSFRPEPLMSSLTDNLTRMVFALLPESKLGFDEKIPAQMLWQTGGRLILQTQQFTYHTQKEITGTETYLDTARRLSTTKERTKYLFEVVKQRMNVTSQTFFPEDIAEAWKSRKGSSAEINMILLNLLRKVDVICNPVIFSTRENGKVHLNFPSIAQLNGLDVVVVDVKSFFVLDASLKHQSYNTPPPNILERDALLLEPNGVRWMYISDHRVLDQTSQDLILWFNEKNEIEGKSIKRYYDYARQRRLEYIDREETAEKQKSENPAGIQVTGFIRDVVPGDDSPLEETTMFTYAPNSTEDFHFINPVFFSPEMKNPFTSETRKSDVEFGSNQVKRIGLKLEIPQGFEVESLPAPLLASSPDSSLVYKRISNSDGVNVYFSQTFEIRKTVFKMEEYESLREFYKFLATKMNEEIVLRKKKN